jgi:hypothetical protein
MRGTLGHKHKGARSTTHDAVTHSQLKFPLEHIIELLDALVDVGTDIEVRCCGKLEN